MKKKLFLLPAISATIFILVIITCLWEFFNWRPIPLRDVCYVRLPGRQMVKRDYVEIHFTGDEWKDNIKQSFAQLRVHEIIESGDTLHGVHFSYGDSATYQLLIRTFDLLTVERAECYICDNAEIWFFNCPKLLPRSSQNVWK
ncbi:hypothetical protein [Chitinophaga sp.]|uniref:hypothetical protein n=1 Tax=Chitinophaga sp. TaxID=1869181 RepID=UPI0031D81799